MEDKKQKAQAQLEALLAKIDPQEAMSLVEGVFKELSEGKSLAQALKVPRPLLFDLARQAYLKFQGGRLDEAESVFKGLSIYEPNIAYFHTALGAIHQKQKRYLDALAEYTVALEIEPRDLTALCNRAEIFLESQVWEAVAEDLKKIKELDPEAKSPWTKRARLLKKKLEVLKDKKAD